MVNIESGSPTTKEPRILMPEDPRTMDPGTPGLGMLGQMTQSLDVHCNCCGRYTTTGCLWWCYVQAQTHTYVFYIFIMHNEGIIHNCRQHLFHIIFYFFDAYQYFIILCKTTLAFVQPQCGSDKGDCLWVKVTAQCGVCRFLVCLAVQMLYYSNRTVSLGILRSWSPVFK